MKKYNTEIPVLDQLSVVGESLSKIYKSINLFNNVLAKMQVLNDLILLNSQIEMNMTVEKYIVYEYITEKQYNDIIKKIIDKKGEIIDDFNGMLENIKQYAKPVCASIKIPVICYSIPLFSADVKENDENINKFNTLYNYYTFIKDEIFNRIFENGDRLTINDMKKLNSINKSIKTL